MHPPVTRFSQVDGDPDVAALSGWERARHDRLRVPAARLAFAAAHLLVREVLADLAGRPEEIAQRCDGCGGEDHGRPYVVGRDDLFVSLSHSHRGGVAWVAAMAARGPCGIDVQLLGRVPDRALTPRELAAAADDLVVRNRLWARKEAVIKAGAASLDELGSLDVLDPPHGLEEWTSPDGEAVGAWIVR